MARERGRENESERERERGRDLEWLPGAAEGALIWGCSAVAVVVGAVRS